MITIYHNPRCSKSRQTLALLEQQGIQPKVIEYLKTPPSKAELTLVLNALKISARDLMRTGESEYKQNNLNNPDLTEDQLIGYLLKFPKLIQRPIVINNHKAAIGRPPEQVLEIL